MSLEQHLLMIDLNKDSVKYKAFGIEKEISQFSAMLQFLAEFVLMAMLVDLCWGSISYQNQESSWARCDQTVGRL